MNIHHLELFYYVARHGGITEAVRNIPYGIQQPAVSGQVAQLEEYLGVVLFQRRPFALTPAGDKLYKFIQPFFSSLDGVASELQGGKTQLIRIGASNLVLRDHLPTLCQQVRKKFPDLKVSLREGYHVELEAALARDELDLLITLIEKKTAPGVHSLPLVELPLCLLVPRNSRVTDPAQLWKRDRIQESLICLPAPEGICKRFQEGLRKLEVDWFPSVEVSSIDLIETYVATGFGLGVSVMIPGSATTSEVRVLPLDRTQFPPLVGGALWTGRITSVIQAFLDEMQVRAKRFNPAPT